MRYLRNPPKWPLLAGLWLGLALACPLAAFDEPRTGPLAEKAFHAPDLFVPAEHQPLSALPAEVQSLAGPSLGALGVSESSAFYDARAAAWGTLVLSQPLLPGVGASGASPEAPEQIGRRAGQAFLDYVRSNAGLLGIDAGELAAEPRVAVHGGGRLIQVHAARSVDGIPVRDSFVTGVINHGNLVLYGARKMGRVDVATRPSVAADTALAAVQAHLAPWTVRQVWRRPELVLLPAAPAASGLRAPGPGQGYRFRLAWSVGVRVTGDDGTWEALVDAQGGDLLAFADQNQYLTRRVTGGIFPVSNDGTAPDGVEVAGHPMPYVTVLRADGSEATTNSAGLTDGQGVLGTALEGPYVRIADDCGTADETSGCLALDLGTSGGTDCAVPAGASAGNTHSARTGFYELNRIIEQARGWLPDVAPDGPGGWLNRQLTANMNINNSCNAFFTFVEGTVNFYRQGNGCRNTGEIAAVFDHEWGHGLDFNDNSPGVSRPGEAYADVAAMVRLNTSCIGRGFFQGGNCSGFGDACTACSGVRDIDWARHAAGKPHDIDWVTKADADPPGGCSTGTPSPLGGPCGYGVHCEGQIVGEAFYDLLTRDLRCHPNAWNPVTRACTAHPTAIDARTALEIVARLFYEAAGNVTSWYQCVAAAGGCNADSGYLQLLAADDDNGNLLDGTPHGKAIYAAFARHQLACPAVNPGNGGCLGAPAAAPSLTASATVSGASLSWNPVPGAGEYWVFRTEGVLGCSFGKVRVGRTTATTFSESGLLDGFRYFYSVLPVGGAPLPGGLNQACMGPMSACAEVVPLAPADSSGPDLAIEASAAGVAVSGGDGDPFLDNCETAAVGVQVANAGGVPLTNVRVVAVRTPSHPQVQVLTPLPLTVAAALPTGCGNPAALKAFTLSLYAQGLAHGDSLEVEVDVTADQLGAAVRTGLIAVAEVESDYTLTPSVRYGFETGSDGWEVRRGSFEPTLGPGAQGSLGFLRSSSAQDFACDEVRSPLVVLTPSSTLSLYNQYVIEPTTQGHWYDRANVGVVPQGGARTLVTPDGGRLYSALPDAMYAGCNNEPGWAGAGPLWVESTFSAAALGSPGLAGQPLRLSVTYGTDSTAALAGFQLDQVTLTDVKLKGPDGQADGCMCGAIDDSSPQVRYINAKWYRKLDPRASFGSYTYRFGTTKPEAEALVTFNGGYVVYDFALSNNGGKADVYLDGQFRETIDYWNGQPRDLYHPDKLNFGQRRIYHAAGGGSHTLRLVLKTPSIYVDGFAFECGVPQASAIAAAQAIPAEEPILLTPELELQLLNDAEARPDLRVPAGPGARTPVPR